MSMRRLGTSTARLERGEGCDRQQSILAHSAMLVGDAMNTVEMRTKDVMAVFYCYMHWRWRLRPSQSVPSISCQSFKCFFKNVNLMAV